LCTVQCCWYLRELEDGKKREATLPLVFGCVFSIPTSNFSIFRFGSS